MAADEELKMQSSKQKAKEHVMQLQRLEEKDPEFYQFLQQYDMDLLKFNDEDIDEDEETGMDDLVPKDGNEKIEKPPAKFITTEMVDRWCKSIKENGSIGAVRSLLRSFRTACHYGDDVGDATASQFSIVSSSVFNKIMVFALNEMDGILRGLLIAPSSGGKKETIMELMSTNYWKKYGNLMRLYLGNALHILTQMTDEQMISFTLKRVKASAVFLAAFPTLLRKYIKVALHCWGTGRGALPVVSFLFLRDLCVRLGSDCLDSCLKGVYKAYVMNCKLPKNASRSKLQHINFLANCVAELYGVDPASAYQHAFIFIRQLAMILHGALTERGPKAEQDKKKGKKQNDNKGAKQSGGQKPYQKVYDWQFICCLELWTRVICAYNAEADFRPLAYPLSQVISGVASLVPTARYVPLRLRCIRMLNRIAEATGTFIPVSSLLLDMLEMKELKKPPTGGIGKAVNLFCIKQLDKATLNTRGFQEACISSVVEELADHLTQWSYAVGFFELSFIPLVRLRSFCKTTKNDRFRREIRELVRQVEANSEFTNSRRAGIEFSPNDPAASSFMKAEDSGSSPLSKYHATIRLKAQQRSDSMAESSVLVGSESSVFGSKLSELEEEEDYGDAEDGATVFNSSWLPEKKAKAKKKAKASKKRDVDEEHDTAADEDIVEDLVLSSDEEDDGSDDGDGLANGQVEGNKQDREVATWSGKRSKNEKFNAGSKKNKGNRRQKKRRKVGTR